MIVSIIAASDPKLVEWVAGSPFPSKVALERHGPAFGTQRFARFKVKALLKE